MKRKDLQPGDVFVYLTPTHGYDEDGLKPTRSYYAVDGEVQCVPGGSPWTEKATQSPPEDCVLGDEHLDREVMVLWVHNFEEDRK